MRLVALAAVLRSQCGLGRGPQGAKGVVFLSSCAGVDFHYAMLGRVYEGMAEEPLLPCPIFRLHGNLSQARIVQKFSMTVNFPLLMYMQVHQGVSNLLSRQQYTLLQQF